MRLADAWARLPGLTVLERDAAREAARLQALACWAGGFGPEISLSPPATLLLEVTASLRLFGGVDGLLTRVMAGIAAQGHVSAVALAPTPLAALWRAADAGEPANDALPSVSSVPVCTRLPEMPAFLASLPLSALGLSEALQRRLAGIGGHLLGDVLRLPRAGLARRFGAEFAADLARALGELPDPRPRFVFPERFCERLELPSPIEHAGSLLFAARRLIAALCGWLSARAAGAAGCRLCLEHERYPASEIGIAFSGATRDPLRIERLLRERLLGTARRTLPAPVVALSLQVERPEPLPGREAGLFGEETAGEGLALLVERLQARLGEAAVHALAAVAEHRPECASRRVAPGQSSAIAAAGPRPCWLLPAPRRLPEIGGQPQHGGPLSLVAGPERIESGWWDGGEAEAVGDVRRDYFIAVSQHKEWLWIFRDDTGWFLHGIYA